jgi:2,4-dienoyl-CoA reductase-like NADH-dependent reductase (Old Yellow Enzyme family)
MSDVRYPLTMRPFDLAGVAVRNRVFLPAHTTNFGRDFLPTDEHVAYLVERARAGVGLVFVEPLRVHRTSLGRAGGLSGSDRRALPVLHRVVKAVKAEGARIFVQITHAGRHGPNETARLPAWGPSAVPWIPGAEIPHAMTRGEMEAVREAYVETADLAIEAGFEGIEVHIGHGHLLHQFLSPAANLREDDWGGSIENRLRYPLEVVETLLDSIGGRVPLGIRASVDDLMPDGLGPEAQREITRRFAAVPGVAFVNASVAAYQWPSIGHHVADMAHPPHPFRDLTEALRPEIGDLPLLTANRYRTLSEVEETLERGIIDMVGMNRAHMADPELLPKSLAGREAEVRPCISHNYCIGQIGAHRPIACMMNARVGREAMWPETPVAASRKRVLVIGGGPAGLEAARVSALAGHEVTVWERGEALGGRLTLAGTGTGRGDLHEMRDWLAAAAGRAGATIVTGVTATAGDILGFGAEAVILAVGAVHFARPLPGAEPIDVSTALAAPRRDWQGHRVAILDEAGSWATLSAAETLAGAGASVEIAALPGTALWAVTLYSRMTALERLGRADVKVRTGLAPLSVEAGHLVCRATGTGETVRLGPFDRLVHSDPGIAASVLQGELEAAGVPVHPIGDAVAPRTLFEAMHDANAAVRMLGAA